MEPPPRRMTVLCRSATTTRASSMSRRWPWLLAALLLLGSAAATACSVYLHWLPCRGSMLAGSVVAGSPDEIDFSDACLHRMDTSLPFPYPPEPAQQAPGASELGALGMALAALAWLAIALGLRWPLTTKAVAAVPALVGLALAWLCAAAAAEPARDPQDWISLWLLLPTEVTAVLVVVFLVRRHPGLPRPLLLRLAVVLWGASAFGFLHMTGEYLLMICFNSTIPDTPAGMGYLTVLVLVISALVAAATGLRAPEGSSVAEERVPVRS